MTRNIKYWIDYWASLFSGIEHHRFSLSLISPRVLLRELKEEAESRGLKNADNRQFLYSQINKYFESDPPTQRCLIPMLTLIRREFEKPRLEVLAQLCKRGLAIMDSLEYFDHAVDALRDLLLAEADIRRDGLCMVCQDLIVELLEAGYSQKFVETVPRNLFSQVIERDGIVMTQFPHGLEYPADPNDADLKNDYHGKLKEFMEGLKDGERIDALKRYPRFTHQNLRFIFQVRGLRGKLGFEIGPVRFYSPTEEKVLNDLRGFNTDEHPELFRSGQHVYLNAIVTVPSSDIDSGAALAKRKIIEALNCLRFALGSRARYEIGQGYVVVDDGGRLAGGSWSMDHRSSLLHWHESLDVTKEVLLIINDSDVLQNAAPRILTQGTAGTVEHRLMDSLHWFRKAKEAEAPEDQLLWLWISIENILSPAVSLANDKGLLSKDGKESVVSIAFDLLPRLRCLANAYDRGWALFNELNSMLYIPAPLRSLDIPDDLKQRAGLNQRGKTVYLRSFIEAIPELLAHIPDTVFREHLAEAQAFYTDSRQACRTIEDERKAFRNDAVMLYRTRNKIVHSASVGDTTLPYYIRSASEFARELIQKTLGQFFQKSNTTLEGIIAALFSEYDLLLQNIERDGPAVALFDQQ